jgi:signal transduction histidine kinase
MVHPQEMEMKTTWSEDTELLLPKITSLILENLNTDAKARNIDFKLFKNSANIESDGLTQRYRAPALDSTKREISIPKLPGAYSGGKPICITHHHTQMPFLRTIIGGLSQHYNNLLMGIWGNITLLGMLLEKNHPAIDSLKQIEGLIQNGSSLIHLLFGFLIERRTTTKRLRLDQLIQEIKTYNNITGNDIDSATIETSVIELSKIRNKTQLVSCMARVMDQMLTMVREKRNIFDAQCSFCSPKAELYLKKIDSLLISGLQMIRKLDFYAETIVLQKKSINLKSIVKNQIDTAKQRHSAITQDLSASIPRISADADLIEYALKQLVDNALDAVTCNGIIHIQLDTVNSEDPKDRCGVHMLKDYVVIAVSDTGKGMTTSVQAKIFDPFFTKNNEKRKAGLGLAAAAGIIKSHGGYIQVSSKPGQGRIFKLYLPKVISVPI